MKQNVLLIMGTTFYLFTIKANTFSKYVFRIVILNRRFRSKYKSYTCLSVNKFTDVINQSSQF